MQKSKNTKEEEESRLSNLHKLRKAGGDHSETFGNVDNCSDECSQGANVEQQQVLMPQEKKLLMKALVSIDESDGWCFSSMYIESSDQVDGFFGKRSGPLWYFKMFAVLEPNQ
ncbi:unnamed protein product [Ilex paraguariensis]|uniref:Uncharacterized protein n=1 Tax=Ilex paraguariensis TaxID=185542 RepID=A0ABC8QTY6_9AQUA